MDQSTAGIPGRRRFPRRTYDKRVGILLWGRYSICPTLELGEGGLSFRYFEEISKQKELVVSFQVPGGTYVSVRADVTVCELNRSGDFTIGIEFSNLDFSDRRLIRSFVASRTP